MLKNLQSVCSRGIEVLRLTVCACDVERVSNETVEQEADEEAEGIGDEIDALLPSSRWCQSDTICADRNRKDNFDAVGLAFS